MPLVRRFEAGKPSVPPHEFAWPQAEPMRDRRDIGLRVLHSSGRDQVASERPQQVRPLVGVGPPTAGR